MGWNGPGCYGNPFIQTPNIDRLAAEGMLFTNAYAAPVSSASRANLISGQSGVRHNIIGTGDYKPWAPTLCPPRTTVLSETNYTIGKMLNDNGYECAIMGKWHLFRYDVNTSLAQGGTNYFSKFGFNHVCGVSEEFTPEIEKDKAVDTLTTYALSIIDQFPDKPFFEYISHFSVHNKLNAPDSLIQKYINLGFAEKQSYDSRPSATYLAMINHFDNSVGRILNKLDESGLADNTIVIFTSDNGGVNNFWDHGDLRGFKGSLYEGGIRIPLIIRWPKNVQGGTESDVPVQLMDLYPTFADIVSATIPAEYPLDGESILPLLQQSGNLNREAVHWHRPGYQPKYAGTPASVIRKGDYKFIAVR